MVQECYKYVDAVTDLNIKLRLIDTLRTVTAGKVCQKKSYIFVHLKSTFLMNYYLYFDGERSHSPPSFLLIF